MPKGPLHLPSNLTLDSGPTHPLHIPSTMATDFQSAHPLHLPPWHFNPEQRIPPFPTLTSSIIDPHTPSTSHPDPLALDPRTACRSCTAALRPSASRTEW